MFLLRISLWIAAFCENGPNPFTFTELRIACAAKPGLDRAQSTGGLSLPSELLYPAIECFVAHPSSA